MHLSLMPGSPRNNKTGAIRAIPAIILICIAVVLWLRVFNAETRRPRILADASFAQLLDMAQRNPKDNAIWLALGWRARQLGQESLAGACFHHAAGSSASAVPEPFKAPPTVRVGRLIEDADAFLAQNRPGIAECAYRSVLEREPTSAAALQGLGLSLLAQGKINEAFAQLTQATHQDARQAKAQLALGLLYRDAGLFFPAQQRLEAATRADPQNPAAWAALGEVCAVNLGYGYSLTSAYSEAETAFGQAVALRPAVTLYRLNWADMQAQNLKSSDAEANYRLALAQDPDNPDVHLRLSRFLLRWHHEAAAQQEAERLLERAKQRDPNNVNVIVLQGLLAQQRHDYKDAIRNLRLAVTRQPEEASLWYALAQCERRIGAKGDADKALARSHEISSRTTLLWNVETQVHLHPTDYAAHLRLARLNAQSGRYLRAINEYQVCQASPEQSKVARREMNALVARLKAVGKMPPIETFNAMVSSYAN